MSSYGLKHRILKQEMGARGTPGRESYGTDLKGLEKQLMLPSPAPSGGWRFSLWRGQRVFRTATDTTVGQSPKNMEIVGARIRVFSLSLQIRQIFVCSAGCWKLLKTPKRRELKVLISNSPTYDPGRSSSQEARPMATMAQKSSSPLNSVLSLHVGPRV